MRRRTTAVIAGAVALVGLGGAGWGAATAFGAPDSTSVVSSVASAPTSVAAVRTTPRATPIIAATAKRVRTPASVRTCSIAAAARNPLLQRFEGFVLNARTGEQLFSRSGTKGARAGSVMKVLTSAAALKVLGPDYRLSTRVWTGRKPGQVVLVGGGDPTLTRTSGGTVYAGAPRLSTLAARVKRAWTANPATRGHRITQVVLDSSYFGGPAWQPSWKTKERVDGYMSRTTALMVDGDRADPYSRTSTRSTDPVGRAGHAFARMLGANVTTTRGRAPAHATWLASVKSQKVSRLIGQALIYSDNTLAEALARVTAIRAGAGNRFSSEQAGTVGALRSYGIDTSKLRVVDGSGLSDDDRIPPKYLAKLFVKVLHRQSHLGAIYDGLPIAGRTGSLSYADRFSGAAARARGHVFAKTGWLDRGYMLSGIIKAKDGTPLTFAFYVLSEDDREARKVALDAITADVWSCGRRLSNS